MLHGFTPVSGVSFSYIVGFLSLLLFLPRYLLNGRVICFRYEDGYFAITYLLGCAAILFCNYSIGSQNLIYCLWWASVWIICYWWFREWCILENITYINISKAATVGTLIISIAILIEFYLSNSRGVYLSDIFIFSIDEFPKSTVLEDAYQRPRGFTSEAGFTAICFECLFPLSIFWASTKKYFFILYCTIAFSGYFLLFSAASILILPVIVLLYVVIYHKSYMAIILILLSCAILFSAYTINEDINWLINEVLFRKVNALSSDDSYGETFSRQEAYSFALKILFENPFGIGWGGISQLLKDGNPVMGEIPRGSGAISLPLEIAVSSGFLGLIITLYIFLKKIKRLIIIDTAASRLVFIALLWVFSHHLFVLEFWFPMIWLLLALSDLISQKKVR